MSTTTQIYTYASSIPMGSISYVFTSGSGTEISLSNKKKRGSKSLMDKRIPTSPGLFYKFIKSKLSDVERDKLKQKLDKLKKK